MEYAERGTLHDLWDSNEPVELPLHFRIRMALEAARGLQHVHGSNIIHRGNITSPRHLVL